MCHFSQGQRGMMHTGMVKARSLCQALPRHLWVGDGDRAGQLGSDGITAQNQPGTFQNIFISSLQKAVQKTSRGKANTARAEQTRGAKPACPHSGLTKVSVKESFTSPCCEKRG